MAESSVFDSLFGFENLSSQPETAQNLVGSAPSTIPLDFQAFFMAMGMNWSDFAPDVSDAAPERPVVEPPDADADGASQVEGASAVEATADNAVPDSPPDSLPDSTGTLPDMAGEPVSPGLTVFSLDVSAFTVSAPSPDDALSLDAPESGEGADDSTNFDDFDAIAPDPSPKPLSEPLTAQQQATVEQILAADADVLGLTGVANDSETLQKLVSALNSQLGDEVYAAIALGPDQLGTADKTVGLLYKSAIANPIGEATVLNEGAFALPSAPDATEPPIVSNIIEGAFSEEAPTSTGIANIVADEIPPNTPAVTPNIADTATFGLPVAQAFEEIATGEIFTLVVVEQLPQDAPEAAEDLANWLSAQSTQIFDSDVLIVGNLDFGTPGVPQALSDAGYSSLEDSSVPDTTGVQDSPDVLPNIDATASDGAITVLEDTSGLVAEVPEIDGVEPDSAEPDVAVAALEEAPDILPDADGAEPDSAIADLDDTPDADGAKPDVAIAALLSESLQSQAVWVGNALVEATEDEDSEPKDLGDQPSQDDFDPKNQNPQSVTIGLDLEQTTITGTSLRDVLTGSDRDEVFVGLSGGDSITTGSGFDQIVYNDFADGGDRIMDFSPDSDRLVLTTLFSDIDNKPTTFTEAVSLGYLAMQSQGDDIWLQFDPTGSGMGRTLLILNNLSEDSISDKNIVL